MLLQRPNLIPRRSVFSFGFTVFLWSLVAVTVYVGSDVNADGSKSRPSEGPSYAASVPKPTWSEVKYGDHERDVIDFWKAESDRPTPLALVIHGGGWLSGTKERAGRFVDIPRLLSKGISVAAINYRLIGHANAQGVQPPVKAPLHDAARALQFIRSRAGAWNIDKERISSSGGSAGACSSLWLAFHDDMADPQSDDRSPTNRRGSAVPP